ncbi:MAG TPA: hypothetical protein VES95_05810 [Dermatophilaceae bacterium]|nr:hypothetical protein [Dermatophilaceae bacterium]
MAAPRLAVTGNLGLDDTATGTQTGTVGEPSLAASSRGRLVTGNWYAAWSPDAGASWELADPFTAFPADRGRFCCDQVYDGQDRWQRAVVLRYPLAELRRSRPVTRRHWASTSAGSLRFVAGAGDTMWFGSTDAARRSVRLFAWPDSSEQVTSWAVRVTPWDDRDYTSAGPGGSPWLSRADDRITGAWRAGGRLGFLWSAGRSAGRPHPYVRAAVVDEATLRVLAEPDLWSTTGAWAYPAAAPNRRGRVGITAFFGGPTHPAHAVGVLDEEAGRWVTTTTATSTHGPGQGKWGDYLTIAAHPTRPTSWVASGFTLQGGSDRRNIEPRVVTFRA